MRARILPLLLTASGLLAAQVKLPPFTRQTLPNGATLILLRKADVPLVGVRAIFRGGSEADPADKPGLAALAAELVRRGSTGRTADQINEQLDAIGATLRTGADRQSTELQMEFTKRTEAQALEVFASILQQPLFPASEVKKVLAQRIDGVRTAKDNPGAAIRYYAPAFFFPAGHPYARVADEASLQRITRDDITAFARANYVGRNLILVAAGDLDPAAFGKRLAALAGALPAGASYAWPRAAAPRYDAPRLLLIDKPDATQTYFMIAMPGIDRTSPDRTGLQLVNTLFGGRFTSMLNDELRVNSGLTYGAGTNVQDDRLTGTIAISTYTRTDATVRAIDLSLAVLARLRQQGIADEQLISARNYIKGAFPTSQLETADQIASVLGDLELFGLGRDEVDGYFARLDALTAERATALARQYYRPDNLQFLLVGNAAAIQEAVKKYAARMKVVSIKEAGFTPPAF
jgi:predicted Zn-dependent peptidase